MKHTQMISTPDKAQKYLEGRPFTVSYLEVNEEYTPIGEEALLEEEYPDIILLVNDTMLLKGEHYVVTKRIYDHSLNKLYFVVQTNDNFNKAQILNKHR